MFDLTMRCFELARASHFKPLHTFETGRMLGNIVGQLTSRKPLLRDDHEGSCEDFHRVDHAHPGAREEHN